jgi:tetratricopeptide (TPR) repeat protein
MDFTELQYSCTTKVFLGTAHLNKYFTAVPRDILDLRRSLAAYRQAVSFHRLQPASFLLDYPGVPRFCQSLACAFIVCLLTLNRCSRLALQEKLPETQNNPDLFYNLGQVLQYLEDFDSSLSAFRTAYRIDPALEPAKLRAEGIPRFLDEVWRCIDKSWGARPYRPAALSDLDASDPSGIGALVKSSLRKPNYVTLKQVRGLDASKPASVQESEENPRVLEAICVYKVVDSAALPWCVPSCFAFEHSSCQNLFTIPLSQMFAWLN